MLRIITGRYHPDLEQALVEEVRSFKSADPLAPLAIVVPSDPLRRRLKELLCLDQKLSLLNVHFMTFHQLAWHLAHEERAVQGEQAASLDVVPELFFGHLLKHIAHRELAGIRGLGLSKLTLGGWSALWTTIRDLKDAMVDPAAALRGIDDGIFGEDDADTLRSLFTLYAAVQAAGRALKVGSADDLAVAVQPWVPSSPWLARLMRVCYYGFYDLTQVQLSLLESIARAAPVTVYFPLTDQPVLAFARRFFERYLEPLAVSSEQVRHLARSSDAQRRHPAAHPRTMNAVGAGDELTLTCKEILTLVETNGYRFDEIGVVARTLEPYRATLQRTFEQHRIPFVTTAASPLLQEPAAKTVLQLALLPRTKFYRAPMLDVLTSPHYRLDLGEKAVEPRPDLWRLVVRSLGITRGEEEWRRLEKTGSVQVWIGGNAQPDAEPLEVSGEVSVDLPQVTLLAGLVTRLVDDFRTVPQKGRVGELTDTFLDVAGRHLVIPGLEAPAGRRSGRADPASAVGAAIAAVFQSVRLLDRLEETVSWDEWVDLLTQAMERATIPVEPFAHTGVQVLDAMAARGLSFRALFVLGLNEKLFPRSIREDAFLRDRHRQVLSETLGYKIDEKLGGYEEEQLLFALLQAAARDRLYLSYQRADADGRPLAASSYVDEFLHDKTGRERAPDVVVPRRLSERLALPLFTPLLLTREELALGEILHDRDPAPLLDASGRSSVLFRNGVAALRELEGASGVLGLHDGCTGTVERHWADIAERGLAPTPLEQYARCPFQYFLAQVLGLEPVRGRTSDDVPAQVLGALCHDVLQRCYPRLLEDGWPQKDVGAKVPAQIAAAVETVFADHAHKSGTGYPLVWQIAKETIAAVIAATVQADREDYQSSGFQPASFEVEAEGSLPGSGPESSQGLRVRGRLDRVDRRENPPGIRIVDYKYRIGPTMKSEDRNLLGAAIHGFRLQPLLYGQMMPKETESPTLFPRASQTMPETVSLLFLAPRWAQRVTRSSFDPSAWKGPAGRLLAETLQTLIEGIRAGTYVILPDGYCEHCEFAAACRRFHGPTWWRAHISSLARRLRQLRKLKVPHE